MTSQYFTDFFRSRLRISIPKETAREAIRMEEIEEAFMNIGLKVLSIAYTRPQHFF